MRILKDNTAAVIIDIQEKLFPHMNNKDILEENTIKLINGLNTLNIPLIITEQYPKGLGTTTEKIKEQIKKGSYIDKISFSCCDEPNFMDKLNSLNKKFIILAGIETHVCVLQTAIDLISNNFLPVIIENCTSSRKALDKNTAIKRIYSEGAVISTYESLLFELCRFAGTEIFKKLSKIIK
jgi:nicotinamidase-related amidase